MVVTSARELVPEHLRWVSGSVVLGKLGCFLDVAMPTCEAERVADAKALSQLLGDTNHDVYLLDRAQMHELWAMRDEPGQPAVVHDKLDGRITFESALHQDVVLNARGLELLAQPDTAPAALGAAAAIAAALRTGFLNDERRFSSFVRVKCLGVAPVLPHPPYCTQTPEEAHATRMFHIARSLKTNLSLRRDALPLLSQQHPEISTFEGRYLGKQEGTRDGRNKKFKRGKGVRVAEVRVAEGAEQQ